MCSNAADQGARIRHLAVGGVLTLGMLGAAACGYSVKENSAPRAQAGMSTASQRVPGEYIVTMQGEGDASLLRELYASHGVVAVKDLGGGRFLIKLKQDPGASEVQRIGLASERVKAVQPNFVYRRMR